MALYFVFRRKNRRLAYVGLTVGLLFGSIFTFGQLVRGAHFLSHNLWSAGVCWGIELLLAALMLRPLDP